MTINTGRGLCGIAAHKATYKGYPYYFEFESVQTFIDYVRNKTILDIGSGYGNLARELFVANANSKVYSLNPSLKQPDFKKQMDLSFLIQSGLHPIKDKELIESAHNFHDQHALPAKWDKIPLPDESIDIAVSLFAFPFYAKTAKEIKTAITEILRTVRPDGEIWLFPQHQYAPIPHRISPQTIVRTIKQAIGNATTLLNENNSEKPLKIRKSA